MVDRAEKRGLSKPAEAAKADNKASEAKMKSDEPAQATPEEQKTSTATSSAPEDIAAIAVRHIKERDANYARHDRERSEMNKRHEKDFKDLSARHGEEISGPKMEGA